MVSVKIINDVTTSTLTPNRTIPCNHAFYRQNIPFKFKKLLYFVVINKVINVEDVLNCKLNAGYAEIQFLTKKRLSQFYKNVSFIGSHDHVCRIANSVLLIEERSEFDLEGCT